MVKNCTIQFFNHTIFQISYGYKIMSNSNTYLYVSRSEDIDSVNDILKTLSNYHSALVKDFLDQPIRSHKIFAPFTRSN